MPLPIGQTDHQYITPIKGNLPGYRVAIPHPTLIGKYVVKRFFGLKKSLSDYLQTAIAWRDSTYLSLYGAPVPARAFHRQQANSNTDIPGVRFVDKVVKSRHIKNTARYIVPCVIAEIHTVPGSNYKRPSGYKAKIFSIKKYGAAEAVRLATAWRRHMQEQLKQQDQAL